jgi:cardiolipin synthase A/B
LSELAGLAWLASAAALLVGVLAAWHALLFKRDPRGALLWVALCLLLPYFGALAYLLFGVNRIRTRSRHRRRVLGRFDAGRGAAPAAPAENDLPAEWQMLARVGARAAGTPLLPGNAVEPLADGDAAYPAMLAAIRAAERYVYLSSYIFGAHGAGEEFVHALAAAVRRGVEVRVLIDGVGEWYTLPRARPRLEAAGVRVARFLPPRVWPPALHVNLRNHRKILVSDGEVAFTGGINIADYHVRAGAPRRVVVSDLHFRLRGPVATEIERVFAQDWRQATDEILPEAPAASAAAGASWCRVISDGPNEDLELIAHVLLGVISAARDRIGIMTPYFLPTRELVGGLMAAALRGVAVQVVLPGRNNWPPVHWASRNLLMELLRAGVEVHYQPPPFAHSKFLVVDDHYAHIGSANLDTRSLRLNFELDVEVLDGPLVGALWARLAAARAAGRAVTLEEIAARPLLAHTRDALCWLASPYL